MRRPVLGPMPCVGWGAKPGGAAPPSYVGTKAAALDGVDEYLTGASYTINTTGVAVSCWFLATNTTAEKVLVTTRVSASQYLSLYLVGADLKGAVRRSPGGEVQATAAGVIVAGQWHHAVMCVDDIGGGNARARVWLDGSLVATATGATTHGALTAPVYYGRVASSAIWYLNGKLCDAFWWAASLTNSDVTAMWNGGVRGDPEALSGLTATRGYPFQATDNMTGTSGSIADIKGGTALTPFNTEAGDLVAGP